ncbi:hypothetical protein M0805_000445 [Coniferiporia weirii]|nr:hypothetical protein M0805_000445 [Coniferiporia weirii]
MPELGSTGGAESQATQPAAPETLAYEIINVPEAGEPGRDELRQQCYDVRIAVFTHEQGFPLETEIDDLDESATHLILRLVPSLTPIGTIRASRSTAPTVVPGSDVPTRYYKLSRLAVLREYRAHRLGRALVLALHTWVLRDAQTRRLPPNALVPVVAHSQLPARAFYAKYGYKPEGDEFDEDGAPHQAMVAWLRVPDAVAGAGAE